MPTELRSSVTNRRISTLVSLSEAGRKAFQMHPQGVQFFDESLQQSYNRGQIEGRAAEKAADVLDVLDARGLAVSDGQRERIVNCKDLEVLSRWHRQAITIASANELFE